MYSCRLSLQSDLAILVLGALLSISNDCCTLTDSDHDALRLSGRDSAWARVRAAARACRRELARERAAVGIAREEAKQNDSRAEKALALLQQARAFSALE
eukprot:5439259-Pleurochrysis_carterae.AAC.1